MSNQAAPPPYLPAGDYPKGGQYPPQGGQYPPPGGQYPPQGGQYPPPGGQYPPPGSQYPPPGGQYPPQQPYPVVQAPAVVVVSTPVLGRYPVQLRCPNCNNDVMTRMTYETGVATWIIALVLCFIGLAFGCCLIPFCVDGCKDAVHHCPSCNSLIGRKPLM